MNVLKQYYLLCLIAISYFTFFAHQEIPAVVFSFDSFQSEPYQSNIKHGICTTHNISPYNQQKNYTHHNRAYYASLSPQNFQQAFQNSSDINKILNQYPLYAFKNFLEFARSFPEYETHILLLYEKIKNDKTFRKQTAYMPYFTYSFSLRHEKSGFHEFVAAEAQRIINTQKQKTVSRAQKAIGYAKSPDLDVLAHHYSYKLQKIPQKNNFCERLAERIDAINKTRDNNGAYFDYSAHVTDVSLDDPDIKIFQNKYGTYLDCQLHKELCQARNTMRQLEYAYPKSAHVRTLAPVVYHYTIQAKTEKSLSTAFELSDFCHTITQVLISGMHALYDASSAIGKGTWKAVNTFVSIEHWKEMVTGALQCGLLFADAIGQEDALHYALVLAATTDDSDALLSAAKKYSACTQSTKDAINLCLQETYKRIKTMSWQEILEHGAEVGVTIILDTLMLNVADDFTHAASNVFTTQIHQSLERGVLFTEQYAVEVAGFGKLILEEGTKISVPAAKIIKTDLALFATNNSSLISQQIKNKITQLICPKYIAQKIRNVGDDILDIMEKTGGHTLKKHVAKTHNNLISRAMEEINDTVTAFSNKRTAINAIKENLRHNAEAIASWLATNPVSNTKKSFCFLHSHPIGEGIIKGKKNTLHSLNESKIVLVPCCTNEFGFEIITSFPVSK